MIDETYPQMKNRKDNLKNIKKWLTPNFNLVLLNEALTGSSNQMDITNTMS